MIEKTLVKELGKIVPKLREKGRLDRVMGFALELQEAAENRPKRLFTKNIGLC